ncbi:hypothetical protein D3C85_1739240 [compost metagenome]
MLSTCSASPNTFFGSSRKRSFHFANIQCGAQPVTITGLFAFIERASSAVIALPELGISE